MATDTFAQSTWSRWTSTKYDDASRPIFQRLYSLIPGSDSGSPGTNYDQTDFAVYVSGALVGYDLMGRNIRLQMPSGTITRKVLDSRGRQVSSWTGTNDTGATITNPTGEGASGNNMVKTESRVYDGGAAGGNGNLTLETKYASATDTRTTAYSYDFRNRNVVIDGEIDLYLETTYDNLNRPIQYDRYHTDSTGHLIGRSTVSYDNRGRIR